jgi:CobQ-like glutamine amidotransferase family enzyme
MLNLPEMTIVQNRYKITTTVNAKYSLKINHLYSNNLNIYGDLGNIITLQHHAELQGIDLEVVHTEIGDPFIEADIYFIGGGQDRDQILVYEDLLKHKEKVKNEVEKGKIFLLICGGYQLFGTHFIDAEGNTLEGLGILDVETKALDARVDSRCIGNLIVEMSDEFVNHWYIDTAFSKYLIGFENHGGQTKFISLNDSNNAKPIGKSIKGFGNNSSDHLEGCFYKNIIGSYCHGSLLPKNPHLAIALLKKAVKNKYKDVEWKDLSLDIEKQAHQYILNR